MKIMRWTVAAAIALLAVPGIGRAATETNFTANTAGDLATLCSPQSDSALDNAGVNYCEGFFQGVVLLQQEYQAAKGVRPLFCLPDPAPSRNDAMKGFAAWVNGAPERAAMHPVDALFTFLGQQYACPKRR